MKFNGGRLITSLLILLIFYSVSSAQVSFGFRQKEVSTTIAQNFVEKNLETQQFIFFDAGPIFVGYSDIDHDKPNVLGMGILPLRINFNRIHLAGGAWIGNQNIPSSGTKANFAARLQIDIVKNLRFSWLHLSNASLGDENPASDAFGITWVWKR